MKLYLHSFRNKGIFFEAATNKIFEDLYEVTSPAGPVSKQSGVAVVAFART